MSTLAKIEEEIQIQYWMHTPDGEIYAVVPVEKMCFGPLHYSEIGKITEDDNRWGTEDFEWLDKSSVRREYP
jgi:hypothetical protein